MNPKAKSPIILYVEFPFQGPFGSEMSEQLEGLAKDIATEHGLLWKIWTENEDEKSAGGIYCFDNVNDAERYLEKHTKRLGSFGITGVIGKFFEVNTPLSKVDRASFL